MKIRVFAPVFGLVSMVAFGAGVAVANQPNMENALQMLRSARISLEHAPPNKGGHRERAIELINQAIQEVKLGINYAGN
jgi:hypothetical protein